MTAPARARRRRILSPLTRRILFLNLIGPALLGVGLLYLDEYRDGLIEAQRAALRVQARIVATALSETARPDEEGEAGIDYRLTPEIVRIAAERRPDMIITVDNGIASLDGVDEARRRRLAHVRDQLNAARGAGALRHGHQLANPADDT